MDGRIHFLVPVSSPPEAVEVVFVRSGSSTVAALQEWRSRTTGRLHEVPEAHSYAPSIALAEGATGWLVYAGGSPWVGETESEARRMIERDSGVPPALRSVPRVPTARPSRTPWALILGVLVFVVIVWAIAP